MKKLKRKFLKSNERISFGIKKGSFHERYFERTHFSFKDKIYFYVDGKIPPSPTKLKITFIYRDKNFNEYFEERHFSSDILKRLEQSVELSIKQEDKELYKITFESLPIIDSIFFYSLSELQKK